MTPPTTYRYQPSEDIMYHSDNDNRERFPSRKHPRLREYDYSTPNYYFITICTWEKKQLFGLPDCLSPLGNLAQEGILKIRHHFPHIKIDKYAVMPNHVHMILIVQGTGPDISTVIGQYKAYVTKRIRDLHPMDHIWQTSFHDHIIRNQASYEKIWLYIHANPDNWEKDCFFSKNQT